MSHVACRMLYLRRQFCFVQWDLRDILNHFCGLWVPPKCARIDRQPQAMIIQLRLIAETQKAESENGGKETNVC